MEYALRDGLFKMQRMVMYCLNPYSNGICSKSINECANFCKKASMVLIIILMEYALRVDEDGKPIENLEDSLNPYSNGICSKRCGSSRGGYVQRAS